MMINPDIVVIIDQLQAEAQAHAMDIDFETASLVPHRSPLDGLDAEAAQSRVRLDNWRALQNEVDHLRIDDQGWE